VNYVMHPEAAREHEQQVAYYQERQLGLGERYHLAFRKAVAAACAMPTHFRIVREPQIRKVGLKGFPFDVVYREGG
jgi:hypothetical protein